MHCSAAFFVFQLRSGVRLSIQSVAPLFCAALAWVMLQMEPAGMVRRLARLVCSPQPGADERLVFVLLAFLLPAWASARLTCGQLGWLRHLPLSEGSRCHGLAAGYFSAQLPLLSTLGLLMLVGRTDGLSVARPSVRWLLVCAAGALSALPVRRRWRVFPLALAGAACAFVRPGWGLPLSAALLIAGLSMCDALRERRRARTLRAFDGFFDARVAWRALGFRALSCYLPALIIWGAALLFIRNNDLPWSMAEAGARFGACFSSALLIGALVGRLAARRPVWPWARSLPRSSARRVGADALFFGLHAIPLLLFEGISRPLAACSALLILPFLALRAVFWVRRTPEFRAASVAYLAEGFALAALAALVPWSMALSPLLAMGAFLSSCGADRGQKVTLWRELHHAAAGDSQSWEGQ